MAKVMILGALKDEILKKFKVTFNKNEVSIKTIEKITKKEIENFSSYGWLNNLLNYFELYSLYFCSRVADENIWFHTTWNCYCKIIQELYPIILINDDGENSYKNIKILHKIWQDRIDNEKLLIEKENIEKKIKDIESINIKPIGVN